MHVSKIFFKVSDVVNHPLRNYKRFPHVTIVRNIVYDTRFDDSINMMDLYFRADFANKKYPVLFNIHGGGFVRGGKKYRSGIARRYADQGWFVVNIGYRLAPMARFPAATEDAINALNFVNGLAEKFNLDLSRIVVTGDSAGGYYAAHLVSVIFNDELRKSLNLPEYTGEKPRGLLTFCAPFDLLKCFRTPAPLKVNLDITNCVFDTEYSSQEEMEKDLPYTDEQVNVVKNITPDWPEVFIVEVKNDNFCGDQARAMMEELEKQGVKHDWYHACHRGDNHCTHLYPFMPGNKYLFASVRKFLKSIRSDGTSSQDVNIAKDNKKESKQKKKEDSKSAKTVKKAQKLQDKKEKKEESTKNTKPQK